GRRRLGRDLGGRGRRDEILDRDREGLAAVAGLGAPGGEKPGPRGGGGGGGGGGRPRAGGGAGRGRGGGAGPARRAARAGAGARVVSWGRWAFGFANALRTHGGALTSPLSPISSPWAGSSVLVAGGGALHATGVASGPGPETLRTLASKSSTSSKIPE